MKKMTNKDSQDIIDAIERGFDRIWGYDPGSPNGDYGVTIKATRRKGKIIIEDIKVDK